MLLRFGSCVFGILLLLLVSYAQAESSGASRPCRSEEGETKANCSMSAGGDCPHGESLREIAARLQAELHDMSLRAAVLYSRLSPSPSVPVYPGRPGPPGQPGPQGATGAYGSTGATGYFRVHVGPPGPTGATGPTGRGSSGQRGETGETGEPGQQGEQGYPGVDGPHGDPGQPGPQGRMGATGATGATGGRPLGPDDSGLVYPPRP